jgi:hypothetical protein
MSRHNWHLRRNPQQGVPGVLDVIRLAIPISFRFDTTQTWVKRCVLSFSQEQMLAENVPQPEEWIKAKIERNWQHNYV